MQLEVIAFLDTVTLSRSGKYSPPVRSIAGSTSANPAPISRHLKTDVLSTRLMNEDSRLMNEDSRLMNEDSRLMNEDSRLTLLFIDLLLCLSSLGRGQ